ncbi:hypothetical protein ACI2KR_07730 [Pseudomonas luteola]
MQTFVKQISMALFSPLIWSTNPGKFATESPKRFVTLGALYGVMIVTIHWLITYLMMNTIYKDSIYSEIALFGAMLFPIIITGVGVLLHMIKPAFNKELRLFTMIALVWNVLACALFTFIGGLMFGTAYLRATGTSEAVTSELMTGVLPTLMKLCFLLGFCLLLCGLRNIRKTSLLQSSGDVVIIFILMLTPLAFILYK